MRGRCRATLRGVQFTPMGKRTVGLACRGAAAGAIACRVAGGQQPGPSKPGGEAWQIVSPAQSSLVYARDGSLIGEIGKAWGSSVSIPERPKYLCPGVGAA